MKKEQFYNQYSGLVASQISGHGPTPVVETEYTVVARSFPDEFTPTT